MSKARVDLEGTLNRIKKESAVMDRERLAALQNIRHLKMRQMDDDESRKLAKNHIHKKLITGMTKIQS